MAKVTYSPDDDQVAEHALPNETEQFGYKFVAGKAVEVTNAAHLRKFSGHPFFTVSGDVPATGGVRTAAERESALLGSGSQEIVTDAPAQPQPDKVTPGQADKPDGDSGLRAVHRGRGVYVILRGDADEEIVGGLSKADAENFNALPSEDKEAFVAKTPAA